MRIARRNVISPQLELGQVAIEKIDLSKDSRDDMRGIQHVYADPSTRLFKILEEGILPRVSHRKERPGAVEDPGVLKQGLGYDLDHLHELVNETVRKFLDHGDIRDNTRYSYRTVLENVSHLTPEVLEKVSQLVAESGHAMVRKSKSDGSFAGPLRFVRGGGALPDGRQPAVGCDALSGARPCSRGWRQWQHRSRGKRFQKVSGGPLRRMVPRRQPGVGAQETVSALVEKGVGASRIHKIQSYLNHARRQIDQVDRRLRREDPAGREGVFDLRGALVRERQVPVELGVPVAVLEDQHGFLLHHRILWEGSDMAYPWEAQARFPDLCSFDHGFHSHRIALDELLDALPKKGKLGRADREAETTFREMRRQHVESAINNLEQRGMDRVLSYGVDGFARMVALSMVAFNVHRLLLHRQARRRRKRAA